MFSVNGESRPSGHGNVIEPGRPSALFYVLGPLEVAVDGRRLDVTGKSAALLALLLLQANAWVSTDQIVAALWGDAAPTSANGNIKTYVWQLRRELPPANDGTPRVEGRRGGYRIRVAPGELDAALVANLPHELPRTSADSAVRALSAALDLWRGAPFPELPPNLSEVAIAQLEQVRWELRDRLSATLILSGRYVEAIAMLRSLIAEDPLREGMWARLIVALNGAGRRGEALTAYQQARRLLLDELGVDPGPQLEEAQRQVLAGEPPRVEADLDGVGTLPPTRPAGLPRDLPDFVGREAEVQALLDIGRRGSQVAVVDGMPGSGKTTLALHVAHLLADDYPDGQVFCDLRGHDRQAAPTAALEVLGGLLRSFGVRDAAMPDDADERAALWRSILATRRVLVVLDDAIDAAQIRPLLPGGGRCFVMVTSRRRLGEPDGAHLRTLEPLSDESALILFGTAVGDDRVPSDPTAGRAAVGLCGNLPIAVRIAAHRLRQRPAWSVSSLVQRLRNEQTRLAELRVADRDLSSIFATSYGRLDLDGQRIFRLVGTSVDCDFDCDSVAALAEMAPARADGILEALLDQHLLGARCDGRYRMHPLLRSYAWRLVHDADHALDHHRVARPAIRGRKVALSAASPRHDKNTTSLAGTCHRER